MLSLNAHFHRLCYSLKLNATLLILITWLFVDFASLFLPYQSSPQNTCFMLQLNKIIADLGHLTCWLLLHLITFTSVQVFNALRGNVWLLMYFTWYPHFGFNRFYRRNHSRWKICKMKCCESRYWPWWYLLPAWTDGGLECSLNNGLLIWLYWNIGSVTVFMWCFCSLYQLLTLGSSLFHSVPFHTQTVLAQSCYSLPYLSSS